jgi:hypothetical protein
MNGFLDGCLRVASLYYSVDDEEEEEESGKGEETSCTIQFEKCRKKRLGKS